MNWHELTLERVNEIIAINKKGDTVANLEDYKIETKIDDSELFSNVVGQDSLTRFDKPKREQRRNKKKRNFRKPVAAVAGKPNKPNARNKKQTGPNAAAGEKKPNPRNKNSNNRTKPNNPKK